jgi:hypothetical protein
MDAPNGRGHDLPTLQERTLADQTHDSPGPSAREETKMTLRESAISYAADEMGRRIAAAGLVQRSNDALVYCRALDGREDFVLHLH